MSDYTEVGGVQWCPTHLGVLDETSDRDNRCDMADECENCNGGGFLDEDEDAMCAVCVGTGWQLCDARSLFIEAHP